MCGLVLRLRCRNEVLSEGRRLGRSGIKADNSRTALSGAIKPVDVMAGRKRFVDLSIHWSTEIRSLEHTEEHVTMRRPEQ